MLAALEGVEVEVRTRQGLLGGGPRSPGTVESLATEIGTVSPLFRVEIR